MDGSYGGKRAVSEIRKIQGLGLLPNQVLGGSLPRGPGVPLKDVYPCLYNIARR